MTATAIRWGGLFQMVGAILLGAAIVLIAIDPVTNQPVSPSNSLLLLLASICLLLSLPAMYARQAAAAGWLGLVGHALLQSGILVLVVIAATPLLYPSNSTPVGENAVVFFLAIAFAVGLLLTGIATLRARVYPRWAAVILLGAMASFFFDFFVAEYLPTQAAQVGNALLGVLLALSLAWVGLAMWQRSDLSPALS